jgi:ubiquinone/menaquinone biosynthesis C-methylase UbiE
VADIACGTEILADRLARKLGPDEIYGVDVSDGMLALHIASTAQRGRGAL